ncbi:type VI secretion system tip protein VgrG [Vibrio sp. 03-59-1]|uniref:type VI secretion system tip protein TssI/VgrG n=1 Tax=Vibrio sp. 03-59-1 TaxID=2607607 RepID=UPI0016BBA483|nr:type VI secretion system tip protein TssI/VgrG [Vibrio sp. 03-59-1]NOH82469.1 type VI secretion system tip protein VgrG [Vibrio sp. 03-59-1]
MVTAANRAQFEIHVATIDFPLKVLAFEGNEEISQNFNLDVVIVCDEPNLDLESWLQLPVCLTLQNNNPNNQTADNHRYINGMVYAFEQLTYTKRHCQYKVTIKPRIELLKHRIDSRIFQQLSVEEIIKKTFSDAGILSNEFEFRLSNPHPKFDYCVQYGESDLSFIQRIMSESGLHYHFEHTQQRHLLIIADGQDGFLQLPTLVYAPFNGMNKTEDVISQFQLRHQVRTGKISLRDYDFKKSTFKPQGQKITNITDEQPLEDYRYPGEFITEAQASVQSKLHLEQRRGDHTLISAESDSPQITSGYFQPMQQHSKAEWNDDWLIVRVSHHGKQPQVLEEFASEGASYQAQFTCIPWDVPYRPKQLARPTIVGTQTAFVTGPENEEIYCDEFGRVKVLFHWDRESSANENASCWLRTAQGWAGNGYGQLILPRVGHEVIVSFINGDPNKPLITGALYNAKNRVPYELPEHKTRSTFKTSSSIGADNFNELRFEDKKDQEHIYLHAAKDLDSQVENKRTQEIKDSDRLTVTGDQYQEIKKDSHSTVQGHQFTATKNESHQQIEGSLHQKISHSQLIESGSEIHLHVGNKAVIEAGSEITLSGGGSFINVDGNGVTVVGPAINLGGGSPGSGTGSASKMATLPILKEAQNSGDLTVQVAAEGIEYGQLNEKKNTFSTNHVVETSISITQSIKSNDDEMDKKWLNVPRGQLTFSSEGNDNESSPYFTRIPHIPNNNGIVIGDSGITFGRGLDIGKRKPSEITEFFANMSKHCSPISDNLLKWIQDGAGKTKQAAYEHYKQLNFMVAKEDQLLTRKQQHFLFLEIYPEYEKKTERLVTKADVRTAYDKEHVIVWERLPANVKDVLVDLTYRGDNTGSKDPKGSTRAWFIPALVYDIKNNITDTNSSFFEIMINDRWRERGVDPNRFQKRWEHLL